MTDRRPLSSRNPFTRPLLFAVFTIAILLITHHSLLITAEAQSATATLSGTVEDEKGAVIPGANVTVVNINTQASRQATSNGEGYFVFPLLPPSAYMLTAEGQGFAPIRIESIVLNVGDVKSLQIQLKAGSISAQVQVISEAPLINTSPGVGTVVDRQFVGNLPLNGRTFQSLILLTPGTVPLVSNNSQPGQFSVNGQRGNANYFTVDGVSANIGVNVFTSGGGPAEQAGSTPGLSALGTTNNLVSIDALEEFKIQTSTYSADLGRQPGGQVVLVTRSGTNQFHGTLFEYFRNDALDAKDWFDNAFRRPKPPLRHNQFGGTFSGPLYLPSFGEGGSSWYSGKDRTFFFFSYEGLRLLLPRSIDVRVPSLRLRQAAAPTLRPLLNAFPLPTGPEPIVNGVPTGAAPFRTSYSNPSSMDATSIRIDHAINNKLSLFGRYNEAPSSSSLRPQGDTIYEQSKSTRTLTLGATIGITARLSNDFRFNYSSNKGRNLGRIDTFGGAIPIDIAAVTSGYSGPGIRQGFFDFFVGGASSELALGDVVDSSQRQINIVDSIVLVKGAHQFKFGIDYRRLAPRVGPTEYRQLAFIFSETDVVNGTLSFVQIAAAQATRPIFDNFSAYVQDGWKPIPRLTVDLGLRWEVNPAPHDASGLRPIVVRGVENLPTATLAPPGTPIYETSYSGFAPRFGAAYLLNQTPGRETVLRGGFGVYYDLGSGQATVGFDGYPFAASKNLFGVSYPLAPSVAAPPSFSGVTLPTTNFVRAVSSNLKVPYTLQWNLALEQSLGSQQTLSLSYVASAARRLLTSQIVNQPVGNSTGPRPNPNFADILVVSNGPTSDYHSLQAQYRRRLSRGLQALVNYTWSHAIDEVSDELTASTLDRGNSDFDVRHNFTSGVTYDFPKWKAGPLLSSLFNGWSVDSTIYARSGQPLNIIAGTAMVRSDGTRIFGRPDLVSGVPFWIEDSSAPGGQRINSAAFQIPPNDPATGAPARQGTLGRNVVRLPVVHQINLGLRRQFSFSERWKLQTKAEVFNLFNHPLFGGYPEIFQPGDSSFGKATRMLNRSLGGLNSLYQLGGPRSMQLSLKLLF